MRSIPARWLHSSLGLTALSTLFCAPVVLAQVPQVAAGVTAASAGAAASTGMVASVGSSEVNRPGFSGALVM